MCLSVLAGETCRQLFVLDLAGGECECSVCTRQDWTGRWLLSLTDRVAETLTALCSLPKAHTHIHTSACRGRLLLPAVDRSLPLLGSDVGLSGGGFHLAPLSTPSTVGPAPGPMGLSTHAKLPSLCRHR